MNRLKEKCKRFTKNSLQDEYEFAPKKSRDLKAVSFTYKFPLLKYEVLTTCVEWDNGKGYDFILCEGDGESKLISLHESEIMTVLACLNNIGFLNE